MITNSVKKTEKVNLEIAEDLGWEKETHIGSHYFFQSSEKQHTSLGSTQNNSTTKTITSQQEKIEGYKYFKAASYTKYGTFKMEN